MEKRGLPWWLSGKNPPVSAGDPGLIPASGRSPGEENGYPLQYSCLENPMDRGAWWVKVHNVAKSQTELKQISTPISGMLMEAYKILALMEASTLESCCCCC